MKNFAIIINFEKKRALYEEIRKKDYPNLDALPLTYDWEMLRYNCWDDQKMIRNFGKTTDVCETLIRIIIKDNRIVGVTLKSALGVSLTLLRSAQKQKENSCGVLSSWCHQKMIFISKWLYIFALKNRNKRNLPLLLHLISAPFCSVSQSRVPTLLQRYCKPREEQNK